MVVRGIAAICRSIELLGDERHRIRAALAKAALPHLQFERDILRVLSGKVRNRGRNPGAVRAVAVVAHLNDFGGIA